MHPCLDHCFQPHTVAIALALRLLRVVYAFHRSTCTIFPHANQSRVCVEVAFKLFHKVTRVLLHLTLVVYPHAFVIAVALPTPLI